MTRVQHNLMPAADLDSWLTHKDPEARMQGRLLATGAADIIKDWWAAEHQRGGQTSDMLKAVAGFVGGVLGSAIGASMASAEAADKVAQLLVPAMVSGAAEAAKATIALRRTARD